VGRREKWRRKAIWRRVRDFYSLSGLHISSPIISLVVGTEKDALSASRYPPLLLVFLLENKANDARN
jgi:8-amino-7-oxononanoate synthase